MLLPLLVGFLALLSPTGLAGESSISMDRAGVFEQANRAYETGRHAEAIAVYERLLGSGTSSAAVFFNLGNSCFKLGQTGRAIYWYRKARQAAPRDPDVRANLQFARRSVDPNYKPAQGRWLRAIDNLSLNEWTGMGAVWLWIWLGLLAAGQWKPQWRRVLRGYTALAGVAFAVTVVGLGTSAYARFGVRDAVVVDREAEVRFGPLAESKSQFAIADGAEVQVVGEKDGWLQVVDASQRVGWIERNRVMELEGPRVGGITSQR